jgi:hypothetical protein
MTDEWIGKEQGEKLRRFVAKLKAIFLAGLAASPAKDY